MFLYLATLKNPNLRIRHFSSVGSVLLTVYGVQLIWRRFVGGRRLLVLSVALLVAANAARTLLRNKDWHTRETLLRYLSSFLSSKALASSLCISDMVIQTCCLKSILTVVIFIPERTWQCCRTMRSCITILPTS